MISSFLANILIQSLFQISIHQSIISNEIKAEEFSINTFFKISIWHQLDVLSFFFFFWIFLWSIICSSLWISMTFLTVSDSKYLAWLVVDSLWIFVGFFWDLWGFLLAHFSSLLVFHLWFSGIQIYQKLLPYGCLGTRWGFWTSLGSL